MKWMVEVEAEAVLRLRLVQDSAAWDTIGRQGDGVLLACLLALALTLTSTLALTVTLTLTPS